MNLDAKIPSGPLEKKWDKARQDLNLVNPANGLKVMGWQAVQKIDAAGEPYYEIDNAAPINTMSIPAGAVIPPSTCS